MIKKISQKEQILNAHAKEPMLKPKQLAEKYGFNLNYTRKVLYRRGCDFNPSILNVNDIPNSLVNKVYRAIKNRRCDLIQLANKFKVPPQDIQSAIEELKNNHRAIDNFKDGSFQMASGQRFESNKETMVIDTSKTKEKEFCIGAIADTHIGSKYERLDVLHDVYDRFEKAGVKTVYHAGNWIDGEKVFNKFDIYAYGIEAQVNNFIENYPKKSGIKTFIISGDDHEGWYVQKEHIDIGKYMEMKAREAGRRDLFDLGYMEANITYKQELGSGTIRVHHPGGGSAYATSYKSQKYVESLQGGEKPQILITGHYHKFDYSYPREVHAIQCGCVQDQTPFMKKRNLACHVGACILWIKQNELGIFTSVKIEWMPYYDKKFYTYFWKKA